MDIREVERKVLEFVAEGTQEAIIMLDHKLEFLGYDSVDVLDITMEMEKTYNIIIPDEAYENWITVQNIVDSVITQMNEG